MGGSGTDILETKALTKRYHDIVAVNAVTLRVSAGSMFGLLGSNGAGKTTLIKMLTTLLRSGSGSISGCSC